MNLVVQKTRLLYLDLAKTIAMLLVIFYHTLPLLPVSQKCIDFISTLIEPFHVSVFYVISGLLFVNSFDEYESGGANVEYILLNSLY